MKPSDESQAMKNAALPIALIAIGAAWLLYSLRWLPEIEWLWILGLVVAGVAILALDGITKSSVVAGPLLILAGILSFFRLYHGLGWHFVLPLMLVCAGAFMLAARSPAIPASRNLSRRPGTTAAERDGRD